MKRGFTLIELLVASVLLGMLVTILTMIFNQSSIAWRVGTQGVANLRDVRTVFGSVQDELDNAIILPSASTKVRRIVNLWDEQNNLRNRAVNADNLSGTGNDRTMFYVTDGKVANKDVDQIPRVLNVGTARASGTTPPYIVNVKSGGPRHDIKDYEAIWSLPDDTDAW